MRAFLRKLLHFFGSYGLAVFVLAAMLVVTLLGTLAQKRIGLYEAKLNYFDSLIAWEPVDLFGWRTSLPLPGGALLMALLSVNLLIGGLIRIRKSWRTAGVIVAHIGIALLMAAGLVAMLAGREGYVALFPGETASEFRSHYEYEVAIRSADALDGGQELVIPDADLRVLEVGLDGRPAPSSLLAPLWRYLETGTFERREAQVFQSPELPFALELSHFVPNGGVAPLNAASASPLPVVDGLTVVPRPKAVQAEENLPAVYARALAPDGELLGETILAETATRPWAVAVGDAVWAVSLRPKRFAMPFEVRLEEFFKDEHPRTDMAAVYRSDVTALRGDGREERVRIEMNQPLRDDGFVMFQASFTEFPGEEGPRYRSQFAVVRNPADKWPEYACWVIGAGLVFAFGARLWGFLRKQQRARAEGAPA